MSRFRKIKRKKPRFKRRNFDEVDEITAIIALVETYREHRPGPKISIDQAYRELEKEGYISKY